MEEWERTFWRYIAHIPWANVGATISLLGGVAAHARSGGGEVESWWVLPSFFAPCSVPDPGNTVGGGSVLCFLARAPSWDCGARLAWSMARFPDERSRMTTPVGFARLEHIASTVLRDALHSPTWCLVPLPPRSYRMWETLPPRWMRHGFRFSRPIRSSLRKRTRPQAPKRGRRETSRKPRRMPLERRRIERVEMQGVVWIKADGGEVHLPWRTHPSGFRVLPDWATPLTCTTRVIG